MSQRLTLELSDDAYEALRRQAESVGTSPERLAALALEGRFGTAGSRRSEQEKQAARERFERHIGEVNLGQATGADNENIDADLARILQDGRNSGE